ncbi:MAG TPA: non-heme iron oxygenase ferredoxin subunit [Anaerolineales bacterium]|nr:non-heme iron oxygenase ferredoxin subunit [Anaerolineales bacterium]
MYDYTHLKEAETEFFDIVPAAELPSGERLFVDVEGQSIVVFNISGRFFAIADVCSHDDGPVGEGDLDGFAVTCPRHGAQFDVQSGKALRLPAVVDIPAYPVRLVNGMIQLGIPKKLPLGS